MSKMCLLGKKYNKLTIIKEIEEKKNGHKYVEVQCDCEKQTIFIIRLHSVLKGNTQSCGCLIKSKNTEKFKKYNTYDLTGEYGIGYTLKNEPFYFDLEDYDKIKDICWSINTNNRVRGWYGRTSIDLSKLLIPTTYELVDHINLNKLDNRKENLRIVTPSQNGMNKKGYGNLSKFGLKGIYWNKKSLDWYGQIKKEGRHITTKHFKSIKDAIYSKIEIEKLHFGEHRYVWENDIKWEELLKYEKELKNNSINGGVDGNI